MSEYKDYRHRLWYRNKGLHRQESASALQEAGSDQRSRSRRNDGGTDGHLGRGDAVQNGQMAESFPAPLWERSVASAPGVKPWETSNHDPPAPPVRTSPSSFRPYDYTLCYINADLHKKTLVQFI
ncbi:hypothetical protein LTR36_004838 [Oleoguttula mirabilis]|uniref:Uncharacterized protein n=1 Tax=Oleoguttula mirabilis TaxID=1507867 RepID=A0AAV9JF35_9PEZI|nr:hypothetical protein LTR36_004838 [Oleoguttula mirabilis]